jgi:hypothetical protein
MNGELKRIWKETVMALSRYSPGSCLEGLRKTTKNLIEDIRSSTEIQAEKLQLGDNIKMSGEDLGHHGAG